MSIKQALKKAATPKKNLPPVWQGPCGNGLQGGVTQGLIARWLSCRERFRVQMIEGLKARETFSAALKFGNMWHACEEAHAKLDLIGDGLLQILSEYEGDLARKYPLQRQEIAEWAGKCAALFPRYVEHWAQHPDVQARTPLEQEAPFDEPYTLPSGRVVRLRGKRDSADAVAKSGVWLQENKSKSAIDDQKIRRQLSYDLQTNLYLIALRIKYDRMGWAKHGPIVGVRYNVVRRAAHKSVTSMLEKFGVDSRNGRIGEWFARWNVEVSAADLARFRRECLDPVLENMCDDFEWWTWCKMNGKDHFDVRERNAIFVSGRVGSCKGTAHFPRHFRTPYCGYNPLAEGGFGDVDDFLATGSTTGLHRVDNLFPELQGA